MPIALAFLGVGPMEFGLLAVLFLFLFGPEKIPEIARKIARLKVQVAALQRDFETQVRAAEAEAKAAEGPVPAAPAAVGPVSVVPAPTETSTEAARARTD